MTTPSTIGVITDTHLGVQGKEDAIVDVLSDLADEFASRDVDMVLHLGDIAHEEPLDAYENRVQRIANVFDRFDYQMTMGNHDAAAVSTPRFTSLSGGTRNAILAQTETTSYILVKSAGTDSFKELGYLSESTLDCIETELQNGRDCVVFSHYPLQYTTYYQDRPFFNHRPEYTFPVNKLQLETRLTPYTESLSLICGHLHPPTTKQVQTNPYDIPLTIIEPVQLFDEVDGTIEWSVNTDITVDSLIFDVA